MDDKRYAELFPNSTYSTYSATPSFGEYAQTWLDSREVVGGTRKNYRISLNLYWMPHLALLPIDQISNASENSWRDAVEVVDGEALGDPAAAHDVRVRRER